MKLKWDGVKMGAQKISGGPKNGSSADE